MKVLITGANGFIGKNLQLHLAERKDVEVVCFTRSHDVAQLPDLLQGVDFVFHLAGVNRPQDPAEFTTGNADLTQALCQAVCDVAQATGKKVPIVGTSSTQAGRDNPYGQSKLAAESALQAASLGHGIPVHVFRLPNVFGKWCKPNYNSAVATFCHNTARSLPIQVNDPTAPVTLVYVDDVISRFLQLMDEAEGMDCRASLAMTGAADGIATVAPQYTDPRGVFAEMFKTPDCGQFSFFTAHPGITRGGHYHHTKTEKFLVIKVRHASSFATCKPARRMSWSSCCGPTRCLTVRSRTRLRVRFKCQIGL